MNSLNSRVQDTIEEMVAELNKKFAATKDDLSTSIKNLEEELNNVHSDQISEFNLLKKITFALATGGNPKDELDEDGKKNEIHSYESVESVKKRMVELELHTSCNSEFQ